jgi:hypothetical protein
MCLDWCRGGAVCRRRCRYMPLCAAICRWLERKLLIFLGLVVSSQAEGRRFAAKLCLAAQASEAGSRTRSRAPIKFNYLSLFC